MGVERINKRVSVEPLSSFYLDEKAIDLKCPKLSKRSVHLFLGNLKNARVYIDQITNSRIRIITWVSVFLNKLIFVYLKAIVFAPRTLVLGNLRQGDSHPKNDIGRTIRTLHSVCGAKRNLFSVVHV